MRERPILFSAPMVRAILNGQKTMTRRIIKNAADIIQDWDAKDKSYGPFYQDKYGESHETSKACPYGQCGDSLWVRETFHKYTNGKIIYRASIPYGNLDCHFKPWRPSIFMPRWASRITLEITEVRVERVQEINRQDAKAEGFCPGLNGLEFWDGQSYGNAQLAFQACWKSINGPESWNANPFVWVIKFKRLVPL